MAKFNRLFLLTLIASCSALPALAEQAAKLGDIAIPQVRIDMRIKALMAQGQTDTPELRKAVREDLINIELMSKEAVDVGLDRDHEVVQQIELARQAVLSGAYAQAYIKQHPVSESSVKEEYNLLKIRLTGKEYHARHILLETRNEALAVISKLDKKVKFETLASEKSKDNASAAHGGDLGWLLPVSLRPEIAETLAALNQGAYAHQPVQTPSGWHIVKLDEVRDFKMHPYEELMPQLLQHLQQQVMLKAIEDLRAKANN
jgi:peptidyl-prolyl cis-trans isomerase C